MLMFLFDLRRFQVPERFVSLVLFFCMLATGVYGEILRYGF